MMTLRVLKQLVVGVFSLLMSLSAHALSRPGDGEVEVWMENNTLCFGAKEFLSASILNPQTLNVDEGEFVLRRVVVGLIPEDGNPSASTFMWGIDADESVEHEAPFVVKSDTCIKYGMAIPSLAWLAGPLRLREGLYNVNLIGRDMARDVGASMGAVFCLRRVDDTWQVLKSRHPKSCRLLLK